MGTKRTYRVRLLSGAKRKTYARTEPFRFLPMLSKTFFLADEQNFSAPLVGPMLGNVRDHIESQQNDHRPSYMPYRGLRRPRQLKPDLCRIFGAPQFATFSTASTHNGIEPWPASELEDVVCPSRNVRGCCSLNNAYWHLLRWVRCDGAISSRHLVSRLRGHSRRARRKDRELPGSA